MPAYRRGATAIRRGLEVGMAHGYWLIGPFAKLGPLRDTDIANLAGLLSTVGLIIISTLAISLYAASNPPYNPPSPLPPPIPQMLSTRLKVGMNTPAVFSSVELVVQFLPTHCWL